MILLDNATVSQQYKIKSKDAKSYNIHLKLLKSTNILYKKVYFLNYGTLLNVRLVWLLVTSRDYKRTQNYKCSEYRFVCDK